MSILSIRHVTTYHYNKPVAFGEHRLMLLPRNDSDQKVLASEIEIVPAPLQLAWSQDIFGNHIAIAHFDDRAAELRFVSNVRLDHSPTGFDETDIEESARFYPFVYAAEDWLELKRFTRPPAEHGEVDRWSAAFFCDDGSVGTHELLVGMTHAIRQSFEHVSRYQRGVQDPVRTLELGSGSCRDLAVLMIAALRSRGIAARFVSGYVHLADDDDDDVAGGNMHAWVQVYVPGPGWVDVDPSAGVVGHQNLVRVAVAHHPRQAIPLQGTWYGSASDHLAMNVAVKVKMADLAAAREFGGVNRRQSR
jgi:transglutaminase-like putative cysteine protease